MSDYRVGVELVFPAPARPCYKFSSVEKNKAESERIPHGVVFCLAINQCGELLRIRRSKQKEPYPDHNSVPAGHMEVREDSRFETPEETAVRELWEETRLAPFYMKQFLGDEYIFDKDKGHVGFAYLMPVGPCPLPVFNEEIEPMESRFEPLDEIARKLETEKWTPPSRQIVEKLVASYPDGLEKVYRRLVA